MMSMPESMRDPNPFHHAASLIARLDRHDLKALRDLIAEREQELASATLLERHARKLKWASLSGEYHQARGQRGVYTIASFRDVNGGGFSLSVRLRDDSTTTHLGTSDSVGALKA